MNGDCNLNRNFFIKYADNKLPKILVFRSRNLHIITR